MLAKASDCIHRHHFLPVHFIRFILCCVCSVSPGCQYRSFRIQVRIINSIEAAIRCSRTAAFKCAHASPAVWPLAQVLHCKLDCLPMSIVRPVTSTRNLPQHTECSVDDSVKGSLL